MSKNIKDIGKELMGKSLNSFHRKTGLTQLEKNNKMQDGILNGILSQVDDAYIENTEQSNVIHLDGSGDGVIVLDSIEGNTAIGLIKKSTAHVAVQWLQISSLVKSITNSKITIRNNTDKDIRFQLSNLDDSYRSNTMVSAYSTKILQIDNESKFRMIQGHPQEGWSLSTTDLDYFLNNISVLEGDWTNREIPLSLEGLQSSFEEKVNDEGKYEIEILSRNQDNSKQNKIKLSINEPLRAINDRKDNICIKDGRLMVERNCIELVYNGTENWEKQSVIDSNCTSFYSPTTDKDIVTLQKILCNILPYKDSTTGGASGGKIFVYTSKNLNVIIEKNKLSSDSVEGFKEYLKTNNLKVVIPLNTPIYEEVLNEHGEPILLEGYENGTIYIDSAIVPTTTVKYTPKMESFNALKEVKIRNTINDFDVTENVIPYMMEVDMKLTELEISAYSTYNIKNTRKMEVLDMTSMQERTFNMLERLIRGKSHTKQEMIDRVLLYEQAKRITTEQALELNLIIEEVYGA